MSEHQFKFSFATPLQFQAMPLYNSLVCGRRLKPLRMKPSLELYAGTSHCQIIVISSGMPTP